MKSPYTDFDPAKSNSNIVHSGVKPYVITDEEYAERQRICGECEHMTESGVCKKCGCMGRNHSRLRTVTCPINKW